MLLAVSLNKFDVRMLQVYLKFIYGSIRSGHQKHLIHLHYTTCTCHHYSNSFLCTTCTFHWYKPHV